MSASERREPSEFRCGACGTRITGIHYASDLMAIIQQHHELCPGYPPDLPYPPLTEAQYAQTKADMPEKTAPFFGGGILGPPIGPQGAAAPATALNEPEGVDERSSPGSSSDAPGAATRLAPASPGSLSAAAAAVANEAEQKT